MEGTELNLTMFIYFVIKKLQKNERRVQENWDYTSN